MFSLRGQGDSFYLEKFNATSITKQQQTHLHLISVKIITKFATTFNAQLDFCLSAANNKTTAPASYTLLFVEFSLFLTTPSIITIYKCEMYEFDFLAFRPYPILMN